MAPRPASAWAPSPRLREGGLGGRRPRLERTRRCGGGAGGEVSNGAETPIPGLRGSKNENGFVFLEKHILRGKSGNQTIIYTSHREGPWGAAAGAPLQVGSLGSIRREDS